jgi:hypothetical protein
MVTRALFRGPAHVCVDMNDELKDHFEDFTGRPIREQFPQLRDSGLFEAMDTVLITDSAIEMAWSSVYDGEPGTMLILPWHDATGEVYGVGLHFHPCGRSFGLDSRVLLPVARVSTVAAVALSLVG